MLLDLNISPGKKVHKVCLINSFLFYIYNYITFPFYESLWEATIDTHDYIQVQIHLQIEIQDYQRQKNKNVITWYHLLISFSGDSIKIIIRMRTKICSTFKVHAIS